MTLADATGVAGLEARIFRGLSILEDSLLGKVWEQENKGSKQIEH